jgi:hypothetical protein
MSKVRDQEQRIQAILGGGEDLDFEEGVKVFYEHLKTHLQLPCEVTGIEDFQWEEPYVIGGWDKKEYETLKKTQPSFRDRYELLKVEQGLISEWMLIPGEDLAAQVRRKSDGKKFCLGLSELRALDKESPNCRLLDDFSCWFVNSR